jgi:four helix bundle protein
MTETKRISSYKELIVWKKSIQLVLAIYKITEKFPKEETYGLISQMRRSAVSIPSNIAEGRFRGTRKDFLHFLRMAYGSAAELETQIEIASLLEKTKNLEYTEAQAILTEVQKMLNTMINKLSVPALH